jgi:hypothetical protein
MEKSLSRRAQDNHVSVYRQLEVAVARNEVLYPGESLGGSSFGRKLARPNQFCDDLGEPR